MKTYSVKEISELLGTNPETIRRWIRSGKLKATQPSKKEGNLISSADLQVFLKGTPKYSSVAAKSLAIAIPHITFPPKMFRLNLQAILMHQSASVHFEFHFADE